MNNNILRLIELYNLPENVKDFWKNYTIEKMKNKEEFRVNTGNKPIPFVFNNEVGAANLFSIKQDKNLGTFIGNSAIIPIPDFEIKGNNLLILSEIMSINPFKNLKFGDSYGLSDSLKQLCLEHPTSLKLYFYQEYTLLFYSTLTAGFVYLEKCYGGVSCDRPLDYIDYVLCVESYQYSIATGNDEFEVNSYLIPQSLADDLSTNINDYLMTFHSIHDMEEISSFTFKGHDIIAENSLMLGVKASEYWTSFNNKLNDVKTSIFKDK